MPRYSAAMLDWDTNASLGPIDIHDAGDDNEAKALGMMRAHTWMTDNGVDRVRLQIVKDGFGLGTFEVDPNH